MQWVDQEPPKGAVIPAVHATDVVKFGAAFAAAGVCFGGALYSGVALPAALMGRSSRCNQLLTSYPYILGRTLLLGSCFLLYDISLTIFPRRCPDSNSPSCRGFAA